MFNDILYLHYILQHIPFSVSGTAEDCSVAKLLNKMKAVSGWVIGLWNEEKALYPSCARGPANSRECNWFRHFISVTTSHSWNSLVSCKTPTINCLRISENIGQSLQVPENDYSLNFSEFSLVNISLILNFR